MNNTSMKSIAETNTGNTQTTSKANVIFTVNNRIICMDVNTHAQLMDDVHFSDPTEKIETSLQKYAFSDVTPKIV